LLERIFSSFCLNLGLRSIGVMSAAVKPELSNPYQRPTAEQERRKRVETKRAQLQPQVASFVTPPRPLWLTSLIACRHVSTGAACLLGITLLPIYGWSVLNQHAWGQSYQQLEQLQRSERQLLANIEIDKFKVAETAERQPAGLVRQVPENTLFLPPSQAPTKPAAKTHRVPVLPVVPLSPVSY
jgi:hypothetical protein